MAGLGGSRPEPTNWDWDVLTAAGFLPPSAGHRRLGDATANQTERPPEHGRPFVLQRLAGAAVTPLQPAYHRTPANPVLHLLQTRGPARTPEFFGPQAEASMWARRLWSRPSSVCVTPHKRG